MGPSPSGMPSTLEPGNGSHSPSSQGLQIQSASFCIEVPAPRKKSSHYALVSPATAAAAPSSITPATASTPGTRAQAAAAATATTAATAPAPATAPVTPLPPLPLLLPPPQPSHPLPPPLRWVSHPRQVLPIYRRLGQGALLGHLCLHLLSIISWHLSALKGCPHCQAQGPTLISSKLTQALHRVVLMET